MGYYNDGPSIESILTNATKWHRFQLDKAGQPYIFHPLRVMLSVSKGSKRVALLHDVVEDCDVSVEAVEELGLPLEEVDALVLLTRWPEGHPMRVTHKEYIQLIEMAVGRSGQIAREVKLADIMDNLQRLTPELHGMEKRYSQALKILTGEEV